MITAGSDNKELAHEFLEYMIEAQTQKKVTDVTGYTPANPQAAQLMTPEEVKALHWMMSTTTRSGFTSGRTCRGARSTTRFGMK